MNIEQRDAGFALLIVLFVTVLLALLISQFLGAGRSQLAIAGNLRDAARANAAADGGLALGIMAASRGQNKGTSLQRDIGGIAVTIRLASIDGLINPNTAPPALLAGLMRAAGAPAQQATTLAHAIETWRSPATSVAQAIATSAAYRAAGRIAGPDGTNFRTIGSLGEVLGMDQALLVRMRPALSLFAPVLPVSADANGLVKAALKYAGPLELPGGAVQGPLVLQIEADAQGPGQARAEICAVVRLTPANIDTPYELLSRHRTSCAASDHHA
jgi:general secretion pathway protein K